MSEKVMERSVIENLLDNPTASYLIVDPTTVNDGISVPPPILLRSSLIPIMMASPTTSTDDDNDGILDTDEVMEQPIQTPTEHLILGFGLR